MAPTIKRSKWTYGETLEMPNIMMQQESLKAMNGRPFRKDKAFRLVQEEMVQRGITKDAKQLEYRWSNLKKRYVDIQKDPRLAETTPFQYYDEIDLLLKGKSIRSTGERNNLKVEQPEHSELDDLEAESKHLPTLEITSNEMALEDSICEDVAMEEEVVEAKVETADTSQRRSQRTTRGKNRRYNINSVKQYPPTSNAIEDDAYRNHKKLVDYQFGLFSRVQRESDEMFLQMSREMLEQCTMRFQTFVTEILIEGDVLK